MTTLADGEYIDTDELVSSDYVDFTQSQIKIARAFCSESGWSELAGFDRGFLRVVSKVKPNQPFSRYSEFKGRPVLRTGYGANPSYSGEGELGIFQTDSLTEIWAWDSESGAECVVTINSATDLKSLVNAVAKGDHFAGSVDLVSLLIKGIDQTDGLVLALAWDGDEASKTVARLLSLWPGGAARVAGSLTGGVLLGESATWMRSGAFVISDLAADKRSLFLAGATSCGGGKICMKTI